MKDRIPLALAQVYGNLAREDIAPYCERVEVAGSIRRGKPDVGDVELVVIPKPGPEPAPAPADLFGNPVGKVDEPPDQLHAYLTEQVAAGTGAGPVTKWALRMQKREDGQERPAGFGPMNKLLLFQGFPCDIFVTEARQWGLTMMIRTGSAEWNILTARHLTRLGLHMATHNGIVSQHGELLDVPDEATMFRLLRIDPVDPAKRDGPAALRLMRAAGAPR